MNIAIRPAYKRGHFIGFCLHVWNKHLNQLEQVGFPYKRFVGASLARTSILDEVSL